MAAGGSASDCKEEEEEGALTEVVGAEVFQDLPGAAGLLQLAVLAAGSGHCCNRNVVTPPLSNLAGKGIKQFGSQF